MRISRSEGVPPVGRSERIWPTHNREPKKPPLPGETLEEIEPSDETEELSTETSGKDQASEEGRINRMA